LRHRPAIAVIPDVSRPPADYAGTKIVLLPISGAGRQQRARDLDDLGQGVFVAAAQMGGQYTPLGQRVPAEQSRPQERRLRNGLLQG